MEGKKEDYIDLAAHEWLQIAFISKIYGTKFWKTFNRNEISFLTLNSYVYQCILYSLSINLMPFYLIVKKLLGWRMRVHGTDFQVSKADTKVGSKDPRLKVFVEPIVNFFIYI